MADAIAADLQLRNLAHRQDRLLTEQRVTQSLGARLAAKELAALFKSTPSLCVFACCFDYRWSAGAGRSTRRVLCFARLKVQPGASRSGLMTTYGGVLILDDEDPDAALTAHLERSSSLDRIGRLLDCGRDAVEIDVSREQVDGCRWPGGVDLERLASAMLVC